MKPVRIKPRLRRIGAEWRCTSLLHRGTGRSPFEAYLIWLMSCPERKPDNLVIEKDDRTNAVTLRRADGIVLATIPMLRAPGRGDTIRLKRNFCA